MSHSPHVKARIQALDAIKSNKNLDSEIAAEHNLPKRSIAALRAWFTMNASRILDETGITQGATEEDIKKFVRLAAESRRGFEKNTATYRGQCFRHAKQFRAKPDQIKEALKSFYEALGKEPHYVKSRKDSTELKPYNPVPTLKGLLAAELERRNPDSKVVMLCCKLYKDFADSVLGNGFLPLGAHISKISFAPQTAEEIGRKLDWNKTELNSKLSFLSSVGIYNHSVDSQGYSTYGLHPAIAIAERRGGKVIPVSLIAELKGSLGEEV